MYAWNNLGSIYCIETYVSSHYHDLFIKNKIRRSLIELRLDLVLSFPQIITHVKKFRNCQKELELFYEAIQPLKDKLLTLLIQFPPSLKINEGLEALDQYPISI